MPKRFGYVEADSNQIPVILGQTNFFLEFDIRFCRSEMYFEVMPGRRPGS
jgi:hypothetical protein